MNLTPLGQEVVDEVRDVRTPRQVAALDQAMVDFVGLFSELGRPVTKREWQLIVKTLDIALSGVCTSPSQDAAGRYLGFLLASTHDTMSHAHD